LSAFDGFMKSVGGEAELHKLAYRKSGGDLAKASRFAERPTADMLSRVEKSKLERTFQNPNAMAQSIIQLRNKNKLLQLVMPFVNTPSNIALLSWKRSPAGFYDGYKALKAYREAVSKNAPNVAELKDAAVDALARPLVGTAILASFAAVAKSGNMTGSGPTDPK